MIRRKKASIFLDAKESTTVSELKKMVRGITKRAVEDMKLYKDEQVSDRQVIAYRCVYLAMLSISQTVTICLLFVMLQNLQNHVKTAKYVKIIFHCVLVALCSRAFPVAAAKI